MFFVLHVRLLGSKGLSRLVNLLLRLLIKWISA